VAKPVIIDTDMALDDWMAILYLLRHPGVAVQAITVSGAGEAHAGVGQRNALRFAALAGRPELPVAAGRKTPLRGKNAFPRLLRYLMDIRLGLSLPKSPARPGAESAVALLTRTLEAAAEPVTIVALGPHTNLAEALQARPQLASRIAMIYVMGGALDVPGNLKMPGMRTDNTVAEWNIYIDPYAANVVLRSGAPITLVPLDATNRVPVTPAFFEQIAASHATPEAEFVYRLLRRIKPALAGGEFYFWDPLAAAVATDESIASFEQRRLLVVEELGPHCGQTRTDEAGPVVRVCTAVDQPRFEQLYLRTIGGSP
jgi:inosine-uridine nucleoside N-ribohydrolase